MTSTFRFAATAPLVAAALTLTPLSSCEMEAAKPNSDISLTVLMDPAGALRSDGGAYVDGQQNVRAVLLSNDAGNFVFDTNDADRQDGGRRLIVDLGNGAPLGPFVADVFIGTVGASMDATDGNLRLLTVGDAALLRRARVSWIAADGTHYSLRFDGGDHAFMAFSCVTDVWTSSNSRQCASWRVSPSDPTRKAALYVVTTSKRGTSETLVGEYLMPFEWTLNR